MVWLFMYILTKNMIFKVIFKSKNLDTKVIEDFIEFLDSVENITKKINYEYEIVINTIEDLETFTNKLYYYNTTYDLITDFINKELTIYEEY